MKTFVFILGFLGFTGTTALAQSKEVFFCGSDLKVFTDRVEWELPSSGDPQTIVFYTQEPVSAEGPYLEPIYGVSREDFSVTLEIGDELPTGLIRYEAKVTIALSGRMDTYETVCTKF
ncbi:MAG: hypothetical protein AB7T49_15425 [Oligoflexales bacterium]